MLQAASFLTTELLDRFGVAVSNPHGQLGRADDDHGVWPSTKANAQVSAGGTLVAVGGPSEGARGAGGGGGWISNS